ncbi:YfhH family protein [Staphylococcus simulans]|uniref:YfhH family protein n=1 Tax=Staphylococcus simulans TaxID=1286 RepID=UPI0021D1A3AB|nr:YfhH family protein [Staphylococcus simulans]UXV41564.1 YfhH family protein [Staphylococcus simulans]
MTEKSLSEMTKSEILNEIQKYKEKMRKAEMNVILNEYDVYRTKVIIAESYLVDTDKIEFGKLYELNDGTKRYMRVDRLKGVFAWGKILHSGLSEEGIPVALLKL